VRFGFGQTLAAVLTPRRSIPLAVIAVPMVVAQHRFSAHPGAVPIAIALIVVFLLVGPYSFRRLFPAEGRGSHPALRLLLYGLVGCLSPLVAYVIPHGLGIGTTFLSEGVNNLVTTCLFWVGGFGLARDIEFEERWLVEKRRAESLLEEAQHAQLLAIRSHLDPHFLFNTLNAIAEWCREDPEVAEKAILRLSSILREILQGVKTAAWPIGKDLDLVESLFSLHRIRDPGRFDVRWNVPTDLPEVTVPPMLLLPLAENAMKHGPGSGHRGTVTIDVEVRGDDLVVLLRNPGPYRGEREGGEGLATLEKRLALAYHDRAHLAIGPSGDHTEVTLRIPIRGVVPGVVA
jgi:LytS/YehU family sensor histidine kinase